LAALRRFLNGGLWAFPAIAVYLHWLCYDMVRFIAALEFRFQGKNWSLARSPKA